MAARTAGIIYPDIEKTARYSLRTHINYIKAISASQTTTRGLE